MSGKVLLLIFQQEGVLGGRVIDCRKCFPGPSGVQFNWSSLCESTASLAR